MRKTVLTVLGASLIAAVAMQAAAASEHHRVQKTNRATATEQFRNVNAYYGAPRNIAVQPEWPGYRGYQGSDGALGSGIAGH